MQNEAFVLKGDAMSNIKQSATELIGGTPLLSLRNYQKKKGITGAEIVAKLELFNPAGSTKDRIALAMIEDAEEKGILKEGATIIEPTSGNTGIGIAAVATAKGYKTILTLPDTMSLERRNLLKAYGAELVLTEGAKGMKGAIAKAEELAGEIEGSFIPGQFVNPANPAAHRAGTGPEIWRDTDGKVDIFVAGVGTGGTLTGVGSELKKANPDVRIWAVEPENAAILSGGSVGTHLQMGIGDGIVPPIMDTSIYDHIHIVTDIEAMEMSRRLAREEGLMCGISSGTNVVAALQLARELGPGRTVVTILPDTGERYISTKLFCGEEGLTF
jgi:cysteine synthase A